MPDIHPEDIARLAVLADDLAQIRRDIRHTAKRPPAKVPALLAEHIGQLSAYMTNAARLGAELSAVVRPSAPNYGEMWGQQVAATRAADALVTLTGMLQPAYDLENQVRPWLKCRSHFVSPDLAERQQQALEQVDDILGATVQLLRNSRSGLARAMRRETERAIAAATTPAASPSAGAVSAKSKSPLRPLVITAPSWEPTKAVQQQAAAMTRRRA